MSLGTLPDANSIWVFPKIGVPQNGWFTMENPIEMDECGGKPHYFGKHPFSPKNVLSKPTPLPPWTHACTPSHDPLRRNGRTVFWNHAPRHGPRLRCYHLTATGTNPKRKKKTWEIPWKSETAKWWGIKKTSQKFGELDLNFFCGEFVPSKFSLPEEIHLW